jgi:PKD repeat protein
LFFVDLIGRTYSNHSELPSGFYFYFLRFDDGYQSELNRMVVTENGTVNVKLISGALQENGRLKSGSSDMVDPDRFVAVIIKDGYVTEQDTISIDAAVITRNYQLSLASKPTADFSFSGDMIVGKPVLFNAASSYGANGENLVYSWDFGNGKRGQSSAIPHVYLAAGDYLVTLSVTGDYGASQSVSKAITIGQDIVPVSYTGTVTGYITDENMVDIPGATVSLIEGDEAGVSDVSGMVTLSNLPVGTTIHLKITKTGYVNQVVRITIPDDTEEGLFFTTMNKRSAIINLLNAEFGGTVCGEDGALLTLPFDGLLKPDGSVAT